jgi:hypothetical protein
MVRENSLEYSGNPILVIHEKSDPVLTSDYSANHSALLYGSTSITFFTHCSISQLGNLLSILVRASYLQGLV